MNCPVCQNENEFYEVKLLSIVIDSEYMDLEEQITANADRDFGWEFNRVLCAHCLSRLAVWINTDVFKVEIEVEHRRLPG